MAHGNHSETWWRQYYKRQREKQKERHAEDKKHPDDVPRMDEDQTRYRLNKIVKKIYK